MARTSPKVKLQRLIGPRVQNGKEGILSLYRNIAAKKRRIEKGSNEKMTPKGGAGRPTAGDFKQAAKTAKPKPKPKKR